MSPEGLLLGSLGAFDGLLFLDDLRSLGRLCTGDGLHLDLGLGDDEDREVSIGGRFHTRRKNEIADVDGLVETKGADIDSDELREIFGETLDGKRAKAVLEKTTVVLDAISFTKWLDGNFRVEDLIHGDLEEIDVKDVSAHRVVLDFLNQGKLGCAGDVELDEDVLADGMFEDCRDLAGVQLKVGRLVLVTIDHSGDDTAGAEVLDGVAADIGAGPCGKFDLFCHKIRKVETDVAGVLLLESEQRADRLASMDAADPLAEQFGYGKNPHTIPRSLADGDAVGGDELLDFRALQPLNR